MKKSNQLENQETAKINETQSRSTKSTTQPTYKKHPTFPHKSPNRKEPKDLQKSTTSSVHRSKVRFQANNTITKLEIFEKMKTSTHYSPHTKQHHLVLTTDDKRYFVSEVKDHRNRTTGKHVGQMESLSQYGEAYTQTPTEFCGMRFILINKQTDTPLSIHRTLETVAEFIPKHQVQGAKILLLGFDDVAQTETGELDTTCLTRIKQVVQFNPATMTGQFALVRPDLPDVTIFIEPKDRRTKSDSTLCQATTSRAFHQIPTTETDSPYRFALEDRATGVPLSLHTTLPNIVPFLTKHLNDGYTVRLTNAEGQAINV